MDGSFHYELRRGYLKLGLRSRGGGCFIGTQMSVDVSGETILGITGNFLLEL